ncbi:MAG TPA: outer membrane protein assembly factor BamE [Thiobacillaceae bacterium]|nr:outer membrane protein assembly factor BamE [Thiobacillaceae bacterium]
MKRTAVLSLCLAASLLSGCGWSNPIKRLGAHKIDIQQGNAVTSEMLAKLKPGMTPAQVRFVLGTPLVVDPFHDNRWDYVYQLEQGGKLKESRRVTVVFENDRLKGIEGDVTPAGQDKNTQEAPAGEAKP